MRTYFAFLILKIYPTKRTLEQAIALSKISHFNVGFNSVILRDFYTA